MGKPPTCNARCYRLCNSALCKKCVHMRKFSSGTQACRFSCRHICCPHSTRLKALLPTRNIARFLPQLTSTPMPISNIPQSGPQAAEMMPTA